MIVITRAGELELEPEPAIFGGAGAKAGAIKIFAGSSS